MPRTQKRRKRAVRKSSYEIKPTSAERIAFAYSPASGLTIPRLPVLETTAQTAFNEADQKPLAYALAEANILQPRHWTGSITASIDAALADITGSIALDLSAFITDDLINNSGYHDFIEGLGDCAKAWHRQQNGDEKWFMPEYDDKQPLPKKIGALHLICGGDRHWCNIGETLSSLEKQMPGLGHTILHIVSEAMKNHVGILTPDDFFEMAQGYYWQGETNEDSRIDEEIWHSRLYDKYKTKDANGKDTFNIELVPKNELDKWKKEWVENGGLTRAAFDAQYPEWTLRHGGKILDLQNVSVSKLKRKNGSLSETFGIERLLNAAIKLRAHTKQFGKAIRSIKDTDKFREHSPSQLAAPVVALWGHEPDLATRILDDVHENECQCGETVMDLCFTTFFYSDDVNSIARSVSLLPQIVTSIALSQDILWAISNYK